MTFWRVTPETVIWFLHTDVCRVLGGGRGVTSEVCRGGFLSEGYLLKGLEEAKEGSSDYSEWPMPMA